jgi:DNA-binding FadR family transcriptional regulator
MHRPIYEAIISGDADSAEQAARQHILNVFQSWKKAKESDRSLSDFG